MDCVILLRQSSRPMRAMTSAVWGDVAVTLRSSTCLPAAGLTLARSIEAAKSFWETATRLSAVHTSHNRQNSL